MPDESPRLPSLISAKEASVESGGRLSPYRLYELARERRIPHVRLGRSVFFPRESLAEFLRGSDGVEASPPANGAVKARRVKQARKEASV